jgi:hypothetical protein
VLIPAINVLQSAKIWRPHAEAALRNLDLDKLTDVKDALVHE